MDCIKDICEMKEQLLCAMKAQLAGNIDNVDTKEAGEVIDMIKDLAEAEYYCTVTLAMEEAGEAEMDERLGYSPRRSKTTGRFYATNGGANGMNRGSGGNMGYKPMMDQEPYIEEYLRNPNDMRHRMTERYGYHPMSEGDNRYGTAFDEYRYAKRNYTETKSPADKKEMDTKTQEHIHNSMYTLKEMWEDADPDLRKKMKTELETLVRELV